MPWYIMSTTICFECLPDLGEMASNQTIQHTKLLNLLENRWISPYLPLIWWIPPSSATSTTTCFMDPPDMSEIAPDPTILDLTEAPPRLGRASDRGRSSPRRHRASDRKEWSDQGRTEPRGLVVWSGPAHPWLAPQLKLELELAVAVLHPLQVVLRLQ